MVDMLGSVMRPPHVFIPLALGACLFSAAVGAARPSGRDDGLSTAVEASWVRLPIREWADRATDLAGRPVIVDRRIDPDRLVTITARGESLREVLDRVAGSLEARVDELAGSIRIVPAGVAGMATTADRDSRSSIAKLPARARAAMNARRPWEWPAGAEPRGLVATAAAEAGLRVEGLDEIPHDHFPAARLPPLSLAERLDLVLAHFDRRVVWTVVDGVPAGRVVPLEDASPPTDSRRESTAATAAAGPKKRPVRTPAPGRDVFSLRLEAPLDKALAAIADRLGLESVIDESSLTARGIAAGEIVRATVQDASRDELLAAVLQPLGLEWEIAAGRLRVFAPEAAATPAAIAAAVAARQRLPSVHDDRAALRAALVAAEVPPATVDALFAAADRAILPGTVPSLDGFLFFTRDPGWRQYRRMFAEYLELPQISTVTPELVPPLAEYAGVVTLPAVSTLTVTTGSALAGFGADDWAAALEFPGLTDLEPAAAAAIARCPALLVFPCLERLSPESAAALATHEGIGMVIGGLASLPDDVASALAASRSLQGLLLPELTRLDSEPLARRLSRQDHAFLPGVTTLSPEIAAALRGNDGGELALPALEALPPEIAAQLVGGGYFWLTLGGGGTLTPDAAAILAAHPGQLSFTGGAPPSPAAVAALAPHTGTLRLPQVERLTPELAAALARHAGPIVLDGITHLDGPDATAVARALATAPGIVALPSLRRVSAAALESLLEKPERHVPAVDALEVLGAGDHHHEDVISPGR
jgi:hypothetical protein